MEAIFDLYQSNQIKSIYMIVIWAPAAAFLALSGAYTSAAILTIWGTLVVSLVDNVIYPILVGNKLRMHTARSFHRCHRRLDFSRCARRLARSGSNPDRRTPTTA